MTREEAIRWLICIKEEVDESEGTMIYISKKQADALGMAIEALSESKVHNMHNGDLISRAEAIKTIHRYKYRLEGTGQTYGFLLEEFENRIPSAEAVQEWIPCSERLPDAEYGEGDSVLCCTETGLMYILYFDGGNWRVPTGEPHIWINHKTGWHDKVIAWMPLPEPYREDGEA